MLIRRSASPMRAASLARAAATSAEICRAVAGALLQLYHGRGRFENAHPAGGGWLTRNVRFLNGATCAPGEKSLSLSTPVAVHRQVDCKGKPPGTLPRRIRVRFPIRSAESPSRARGCNAPDSERAAGHSAGRNETARSRSRRVATVRPRPSGGPRPASCRKWSECDRSECCGCAFWFP